MAFGVTGAYALLDASGSETEGNGKEKTSTEIDHNFGVASIFAEYTFYLWNPDSSMRFDTIKGLI